MAKTSKTEFVTGILKEELIEVLGEKVRVTNDLSEAIQGAVVTAYERAIVELQQDVGFGDLGTFKVAVQEERAYANPQALKQAKEEGKDPKTVARDIVKPEHLTAKFSPSKGFKETLETTEII